MQFDKTLIAIHERTLLETMDLALHTVRRHAWPLLVTFSMGAAPLMLLNHLLIGWMLDFEYRELFFYTENYDSILRYLSNMTALVVIEAPLASVFTTRFLGDVVFVERPRLAMVAGDVLRAGWRLIWCQLLVRGILGAWLLLGSLERHGRYSVGVEFVLMGGLLGYGCLLRAFRPFVNEIILLEKNPLIARSGRELNVARRSALLHAPSSGDLFGRWLSTAVIAVLLTGTAFGAVLFISGVLFHQWRPGPWMLLTAYPCSLWAVAGFLAVVRFLSYLDVRIRHEGWEVELLLRAEAARLASRVP